MLVINDDSLDTLEGDVDNIINFLKAFVCDGLSPSLFQIES